MYRNHRLLVISLAALFLTLVPTLPAQQSRPADSFEKQVRPLLAEHCYACHSSSSSPLMGGLQLDREETFRKGGSRGAPIDQANPEASLLLRAIRHSDPQIRMPPTHKMSDEAIATLTNWVRAGAPWGVAAQQAAAPESGVFWAFEPAADPEPPQVTNEEWVTSPIDRFILAALEDKGLRPAPPANKRALIRRVTFDLIGLPPSPGEVQAFLADHSPVALARVVDRLLESPRYGERWGRHWLDIARYADSNGLDENLIYKNAYRYRDYVIAAFNKDKPYDQFIHEQLAGDLLPEPPDLETQYEHWTATGFLSLGAKMLAEDDPVKMQMDIIDEQLDTIGRAFMGLTIGCARCHDHKFDPIPTQDYYSLAGILKSSKTMEDFNVVANWHEYVLAPKQDREDLKAHQEKIKAKNDEIGKITRAENYKLVTAGRQKADAYLLAATEALEDEAVTLAPVWREDSASSPDWILRDADGFDRGNVNRELKKGEKNVPDAEEGSDGKQPYFAEFDIDVATEGLYQVDFLDQEKGDGTADVYVNGVLMKSGLEPIQNRAASPEVGGWWTTGIYPMRAGKNVLRLEHKSRFPYFARILIAPNPLAPGTGVPRSREQLAREYEVNPGFLEQWIDRLRASRGATASVFYGWQVFGTDASLNDWASPAAKHFEGFQPKDRSELAARYGDLFREASGQWQQLYPGEEVDFGKNERYKDGEEERELEDAGLEAFRKVLYEKFGPFRPPADSKQYFPAGAQKEIARLEDERKALTDATPEYPRAMGVTEGEMISDTAIHIRGSHWTLGDPAPRRFLRVLSREEPEPIGPNRSGRLDLARWLTREDHPLTSRVMVNRLWRWHFGRGIVGSTDNFGKLGDRPTNQPLLDWLAIRFIENDWSIKQMHRLIILSSTYQMSTAFNEQAADVDPENTLLWRMPRRRLEAETIRDAIMAVSGHLDFAMGDTLLSKYKPRDYVSNTARGGNVDYDRNIRAVYVPVVRSAMYDFFRSFDFADPSALNGDRGSSVVAPQALFAMNGSVALEHSRLWAERLLSRADLGDADRVGLAYEEAFARPVNPSEVDRALTFIHEIEEAIEDRKRDAAERRAKAWESFCRGLFGSSEFIYLD
ncbi:MAG: DUF1549 domain-containing protein [Acidobacteria bacterium]|nr:DUF1549 domain-containing protein [Acidobacteriota bacterium]